MLEKLIDKDTFDLFKLRLNDVCRNHRFEDIIQSASLEYDY